MFSAFLASVGGTFLLALLGVFGSDREDVDGWLGSGVCRLNWDEEEGSPFRGVWVELCYQPQ